MVVGLSHSLSLVNGGPQFIGNELLGSQGSLEWNGRQSGSDGPSIGVVAVGLQCLTREPFLN